MCAGTRLYAADAASDALKASAPPHACLESNVTGRHDMYTVQLVIVTCLLTTMKAYSHAINSLLSQDPSDIRVQRSQMCDLPPCGDAAMQTQLQGSLLIHKETCIALCATLPSHYAAPWTDPQCEVKSSWPVSKLPSCLHPGQTVPAGGSFSGPVAPSRPHPSRPAKPPSHLQSCYGRWHRANSDTCCHRLRHRAAAGAAIIMFSAQD